MASGGVARRPAAGLCRAAIDRAAPLHVATTRQFFFDHLSDRDVEVLSDICDRLLVNLKHVTGIES